MPLVRELLIALRTLTEDEPLSYPPRHKRRRANSSNKRSKQAPTLIITFRDLFRSGDLNAILDDRDFSRRCYRRNTRSMSNKSCENTPACIFDSTNLQTPPSSKAVVVSDMNVSCSPLVKTHFQDETLPLLHDEMNIVPPTDLVTFSPLSQSKLLRVLPVLSKKNKNRKDLTVPLSTENENETVETLRKVLKWSPRKQNSAKFAVPVPKEEEHKALSVVQNAVNRVKEEQQRRKKRKFFWMRLF